MLGLASGNDSIDVLEDFVRTFQVTFPILLDAGPVRNIYFQRTTGSPYPLDYVIDQEGKIAYFNTEYAPEQIVSVVDKLLGNDPQIGTSVEWLSFGPVAVGQDLSLLLDVENTGNGDLQVHTLATGTAEFSVNLESLVIPPSGSRAIQVTFAPLLAGTRLDTLWLASNDPARPVLPLPLQGIGGDGVAVGDFGPRALRLGSAPNPFGPATAIRFSLPAPERVWLQVYDVKGRLLRELISGERLSAGDYRRAWDGRDSEGMSLSSGIYFTRLRAGGRVLTRKLTLLH